MKVRLGAPKIKYSDMYPEFAPLMAAVRAEDWPAVEAQWKALPPAIDGAHAVIAATEAPKCETFLARIAATEGASSLARIMLATRHIELGWEARTGLMPEHVSQDQFRVFFEHLHQADRLLAEALSDEPNNPVAWSFRITTARALQLGLPEARRRYAKVAESGPHFLYAQQTLLQQLCPKWGGDWNELRAFVAECVREAGPGALSGALVAEGFIEYVGAEIQGENNQVGYYRMPAVQAEVDQAAMGSVFSPAYRPVPGWVWAHNCFGFIHWRAGLDAKAAVHFRIVDDKAGSFPWNIYDDAGDSFLGARNGSIRRAK